MSLSKITASLGVCRTWERDGAPHPTTCRERKWMPAADYCPQCAWGLFRDTTLKAIEAAITHDDGLDGAEGERILRRYGHWPATPSEREL